MERFNPVVDSTELRVLADGFAKQGLPDPEFFAIYSTAMADAANLKPHERAHYRRMMAAHVQLITGVERPKSYDPEQWQAICATFAPEIAEFRGFKDDLSDITNPWKIAVRDVLELNGDLDRPAEVLR